MDISRRLHAFLTTFSRLLGFTLSSRRSHGGITGYSRLSHEVFTASSLRSVPLDDWLCVQYFTDEYLPELFKRMKGMEDSIPAKEMLDGMQAHKRGDYTMTVAWHEATLYMLNYHRDFQPKHYMYFERAIDICMEYDRVLYQSSNKVSVKNLLIREALIKHLSDLIK